MVSKSAQKADDIRNAIISTFGKDPHIPINPNYIFPEDGNVLENVRHLPILEVIHMGNVPATLSTNVSRNKGFQFNLMVHTALSGSPLKGKKQLEEFSEAIEDSIEADLTLAGVCTNSEWVNTKYGNFNVEGKPFTRIANVVWNFYSYIDRY
jgi:hypothetical protein